jgi:peptide/nickel transport system ATP-binding protein
VNVSSVASPVLSIRNLNIDALTPEGLKPVLREVDFDLANGETLCIAGESGSGKSVTSLGHHGAAAEGVAAGNRRQYPAR